MLALGILFEVHEKEKNPLRLGGWPCRMASSYIQPGTGRLLLLTNALANILLRRAGRPAPQRALLAGVLSIGSAMEVFRWMSRHSGSPVARALMGPGHALQRFLTTEEPTAIQIGGDPRCAQEMLGLEGVEILAEPEP